MRDSRETPAARLADGGAALSKAAGYLNVSPERQSPFPAAWQAARSSLWLPVAAAVLLTVVLVPPLGDFPLNDDWVYAKAVKWSLEEGRYTGHPFATATMATHVAWGCLFAACFGWGFEVLRASTLCLAVVGLWAVARCGRECGLTRTQSLLCAATVWYNPIFLNLSYTFMTDVPFVAWASLSMLCYLRALRTHHVRTIWLGGALSVGAFFLRQFGCIPLGVFGAVLAARAIRGQRRPSLGEWVAVAAPCLAGLGLWMVWRAFVPSHTPTMHEAYGFARQLTHGVRVALAFYFYFGLFLIPVGCASLVDLTVRHARRPGKWIGLAVLALGPILVPLIAGGWTAPPLPNVLRNLGAGPLTLRDATVLYPGWAPVKLGPAWEWTATFAAFLSAAAILVRGWTRRREARGDGGGTASAQRLYLAGVAALFALGACHPGLPVLYDRYLLPALVPAVLLGVWTTGAAASRARRAAWAVPCVLMVTFSLFALQDYLAWNRARWEGIALLRERYGVPDSQIDGGYEFNGMCTSDSYMRRSGGSDFEDRGDIGWWVIDDAYAVSFLPREGFEVIDRVPYYSSLGWRMRYLLVLRRAG